MGFVENFEQQHFWMIFKSVGNLFHRRIINVNVKACIAVAQQPALNWYLRPDSFQTRELGFKRRRVIKPFFVVSVEHCD